MNSNTLATALVTHQRDFADVIPFDLRTTFHVVFDFSDKNEHLARVDLSDTPAFTDLVFGQMAASGAQLGIGRYNEDRVVYRHSPLFADGAEPRSIHIGIDLFVSPGKKIRAPLTAHVHSFADNNSVGDYGPTVILEHQLEGVMFYTLYGHLSRDSLSDLSSGQSFSPGEPFAMLGAMHENGGWPPHLHFQIITDLQGRSGDFPGVAAPSERQTWIELCPDPNLILRIPGI